jgi:hypothetical protein
MNVFALLFCAMLYVKGHVAPSSTNSGTTGSVVMDYYWGTELYPRILGWDVKMFTNCRAGMMFWAVGIVCFAHKNMEVNGGTMSIGMAVNVALQLVYISKFFYWEMGYMCSMVSPPKMEAGGISGAGRADSSLTTLLSLRSSPHRTFNMTELATTFAGDASSGSRLSTRLIRSISRNMHPRFPTSRHC